MRCCEGAQLAGDFEQAWPVLQRARIDFMQDHYPDFLAEALGTLRKTHRAASAATEEIAGMIHLAGGG